jgi:hypothetical protein
MDENSERFGENVFELARELDFDKAKEAHLKRDINIEKNDGSRSFLRNLVVKTAYDLTEVEKADQKLWENHDWYLVIYRLATIINEGKIPDVRSVLDELSDDHDQTSESEAK